MSQSLQDPPSLTDPGATGNILIIDDDKQLCQLLATKVRRMGCTASHALTLSHGLALAHDSMFDLVFLDVHMPDGNGLDIIPDLRNSPGEPEVIIVTGLGDPNGAELAIRSGAWSYVEKGSSLKDLILPLSRALEYRGQKKNTAPPVALKREEIVGNSPRMEACFDVLAQASASDMNVLITGETGTGKELFARAIHRNSRRAGFEFVVVDCAALPEKLVESLLFGHVRGAFTGADQSHQGLVLQADKGTLFLDEVGELPLSIQKSFLRVLQEKTFRPVGGNKEIHSDFRVIAATNRDLDVMVDQKAFRKDLLFRLKSTHLDLPPLRERSGDIKEITLVQIARLCERYSKKTKGFSPDFLEALTSYPWPGNVRELINAIEHAINAAADTATLFHNHLPEGIRVSLARAHISSTAKKEQPHRSSALGPDEPLPRLADLLEAETARLEKWYFTELLSRVSGDIKQAQAISGLGRTSLYDRLKKHGLTRRRFS